MRLYHFAGEAGGGAPGAEPAAAPNQDPKPNAEPGGTPTGGTTQGQKPEPKLSPKEQMEALTKELSELRPKYESVTKKLGEQSKHIGTLKQYAEALKNDPKTVMRSIADKAGIKFSFADEQKPDLARVLTEGTPEEQAKAIEAHGVRDPRLDDVMKRISVLDEQALANRYQDWDNLGDARDAIELEVSAGKLHKSELMHLAARGRNVAEAIEEAKKQGVQEYIDGLQNKTKGQIDGTSRGTKPKAGAAAMVLSDVVGILNATKD